MSIEVDCVVVGAGVVGIAAARALQLAGREVVLLEKEASFGMETSSRNSEVIHAGIYYETDTLKARCCVRGKHLLYEYCRKRDVAHRRVGKLIVATVGEEIATLERYFEKAARNGVDDLVWIDRAKIERMEPHVQGILGLLSPSTGIIDSHGFMQSLLGDFQQANGIFLARALVERGCSGVDGITLQLADNDRTKLRARTVVNSAGLYAANVAACIEGFPATLVPESHFAIGHYYEMAGRSPFSRLVYPVASKGGLGVHVTIDMAGKARFGPDLRWRQSIDYSFDDSYKETFVKAIRKYCPAIRESDLRPAYTGIRPKLFGPKNPNQDFCIQGYDTHGVPGLINLFGIESPGLTASLAIAELVESEVRMMN